MSRKDPPHFLAAFVLFALVLAPEVSWARKKKSESALERLGTAIDSLLVKPPQDHETCFAPDEPCGAKLVRFIESATQSIDMAIYDINFDPLVHLLLTKAPKIPVRLVVDRKQARGSHSLVRTLIRGGIDVRFGVQRGIMHDKFTVVDGSRMETGSFNYTNHAAQANNENQIYLWDPEVVKRYRDRFNKLWSEARLARLSDLE